MSFHKTSKKEVLQKAQSFFATQGYFGTSFSQLAEAIPLSKASLFHYIKSKEELAIELIENFHAKCEKTLFQLVDLSSSSSEEEQAFFGRMLAEFLAQEPHAVFITLLYLECNSPKTQNIRKKLQMHVERWRAILLALFMPSKNIDVLDNPALHQIQQTLATNSFLPQIGYDFF